MKRCGGRTKAGQSCQQRVTGDRVYCAHHIDQSCHHHNVINLTGQPRVPGDRVCGSHQTKNDLCSICLEPVTTIDAAELVCGHAHHLDCIKQLVTDRCPICRKRVESTRFTPRTIRRFEMLRPGCGLEQPSILYCALGCRLPLPRVY